MYLISCDNCGVVFDSKKLKFPDFIYTNDGDVDTNLAAYNGDKWVAKVSCPLCKTDILKE